MSVISIPNSSHSVYESKRTNLISRYPLLSAILLTYLLTWAVLIPDALFSWSLIPFRLPQWIEFLAGWGPAVAAILVTFAIDGRHGVATLLKRFIIARVGWQWYLVALFGLALMLLGGIMLASFLGIVSVIPAARFPIVSVAIGFVLAVVRGRCSIPKKSCGAVLSCRACKPGTARWLPR